VNVKLSTKQNKALRYLSRESFSPSASLAGLYDADNSTENNNRQRRRQQIVCQRSMKYIRSVSAADGVLLMMSAITNRRVEGNSAGRNGVFRVTCCLFAASQRSEFRLSLVCRRSYTVNSPVTVSAAAGCRRSINTLRSF